MTGILYENSLSPADMILKDLMMENWARNEGVRSLEEDGEILPSNRVELVI